VLVVRLWAREPDIERRPVDVRVSTECGVLFEGALNSTDPVDIAIRVPGTERAVAATVKVSRTWRPADVNRASSDRRSLGVAILTDWLSPGESIDVPVRALPACASGS
jgi:hypothetical protein